MSQPFPTKKISEICSLIVDCVNKTAPKVEGPTPWRMLRTTNIRNGRIDTENCFYVDEETFQKWTRRASLQVGDTILTREAPVGEVGLVRDAKGFFLGQRLMQYRADPEVMDGLFLHYAMRSPFLSHQFHAHGGTGSVVDHLRVPDCKEFLVPVPPREQQEAIAATLGALDDKIELNRRMSATLEEMARALYRSWFVGFDPVHARALGQSPAHMAPATAELFPDCFEPDGLPKEWTRRTFETLYSVLETGRRPKGGVSAIKEGVPSIGAESVKSIGMFNFGKTKYVDRQFFEGMKKGKLKAGDILVYKDGGKPGELRPAVSYVSEGFPFAEACINEHVFRVRLKEAFGQYFGFLTLSSEHCMWQMRELATGVAQPGLNQSAMNALEATVPWRARHH